MKPFSLKERLHSFVYAFKGILLCLRYEHNAWIHLVATFVVVIAGFVFSISRIEWIAIILCVALVIAAEVVNTAIERLVDLVSPNKHSVAGDVKDLAAGAVLVCAIAAFCIGLIIFMPHVIHLFR